MSTHDTTLLIDAGNTRVKFGLLVRGAAQREPLSLALAHAELDRLPEWLATLPAQPVAGVGVNVAGEALARRIDALLERHCGTPSRWVRSSARAAGILNLYDEPVQLGSDRWVALLGLAARTHHAAVLASFGTATTIDTLGPVQSTLQPEGVRRFEGGLILPGPDLMLRSLANGTAQLPYAEGDVTALPRNTHAAIRSGVAAAQAGAVLRQWQVAHEALQVAPQLYCTGGGWPLVADEVKTGLARCRAAARLAPEAVHWLDAPVLDGLASLACETAAKSASHTAGNGA